MSLLYLLESLRTPFLDTVFSAISRLGEETVFLVAAIILYWCFSKKWGYYMLCVGFFSLLINQSVKIIARIPRPWVRDPNFTIVESARAKATGYSFPSGHSASITAALGCCARVSRHRILRAALIVIIVLVCFSRMYLGVHYPTDVAFSVLVSGALVFLAYPVFLHHEEHPGRVFLIVAVLTLLSVCFVLFTQLWRFPADVDADNLYESAKNAWLLTGSGLALLLGMYVEQRYVNFDVKAPLWAQLLKVVLGLAIMMGLRIGLKPVLAAAFGTAPFAGGIRYFCMVLFATCIWPMTFRWFGAGCKKVK